MNALRIAWAGPWNTFSAIAEFGTEIVAELAKRGHAIEVIRTEIGDSLNIAPRTCEVKIHKPDEIELSTLRQEFDSVIVNIGDHFPFHGNAIRLMHEVPAVAIVHDAFLGNLCAGWAEAAGIELCHDQLQDLYGPSEIGGPFWRSLREMADRRSMIEWLVGMGCGAVVHARHYEERVRKACPGPVEIIPLALSFANLPPLPKRKTGLVLATIGHINPNKRADEVLKALAASPSLRAHVQYRLIGPVAQDERERLTSIANAIGAPIPEFTGWIGEDELYRELANVDVISCLRDPILEGGSASLILALRSGRPTLVSNHGVYAEIPPGLVLTCPPGREAAAVRRHLEAMLRGPTSAGVMAKRARSYAEETFSANHYVDKLLPLIRRAVDGAAVLSAGWELGRRLAELGAKPQDPAVSRLGGVLAELLG